MANNVRTASKQADMSGSQRSESVIKVTEPPKIPTLNFGGQKTSMFSGNKGYMPKGNPKAKFNKAVFTTQHKGGPSGGK